MRLLDLFCCEGGAGMGYHRAGFDVFGVDLFGDYMQARYPFRSVKGDVRDVMRTLILGGAIDFSGDNWLYLEDFDAIHASPPCQRYSITNAARQADYPDLIEPVRELIRATGLPYVIENVVGAPLYEPVELCGCMFDLKATDDDGVILHLQRARLFESNVALSAPRPHDHSDHEWVGGCYGGARRDKYEAKYIRKGGYVPPNKAVVEAYMGIDWMTWKGLHQSIPPALHRPPRRPAAQPHRRTGSRMRDHGTYATYQTGCRCDECRWASAEYQRDYRNRRRTEAPAAPIEERRAAKPTDWQRLGNCVGADPDLFFPERGDNAAVAAAKAVCRGCSVRQQCLSYSNSDPIEPLGVWGGAGADERRLMRRAARLAREAS